MKTNDLVQYYRSSYETYWLKFSLSFPRTGRFSLQTRRIDGALRVKLLLNVAVCAFW